MDILEITTIIQRLREDAAMHTELGDEYCDKGEFMMASRHWGKASGLEVAADMLTGDGA